MKVVIELDVPDWQIGQEVSVYFPDTMCKRGICQPKKELDDEIAKRCIICPKCGHKLGTRKGAYCDEDKNGH